MMRQRCNNWQKTVRTNLQNRLRAVVRLGSNEVRTISSDTRIHFLFIIPVPISFIPTSGVVNDNLSMAMSTMLTL